jgi:GAF domain-containing protein/HAMP domain-containing protein
MNPFVLFASLTLRAKLLLALVLALGAVVLLSGFALTRYNQALQPESNVTVQLLSNERAQQLATTVHRNIRIVEDLARNPLNLGYISTLLFNPTNETPRARLTETFQGALNIEHTFRRLRYVSPTGDILLSVPESNDKDDTSKPYFVTLKNQPIVNGVGQTYIGWTRSGPNLLFEFAVVVEADTEVRGYLVGTVDPTGGTDPGLATMFSALQSANTTPGTVNFYLLDNRGQIFTSSPLPTAASQALVGDVQALAVLQPTSQIVEYTSPLLGVPVFGYVTPVDGLNMSLIAEMRFVRVGTSSVADQFFNGLLVLAAITLLAFVLIWLYLELTIVNPLRHLLDVATAATQGRTGAQLRPIRQRDEVGRLYTAFAVLGEQLQQSVRSLEARITERTRDVRATRDIGQIIYSIRDLDKLLNQVIALIPARFENIYHAQVFLVDERRQYAVLRVSTGEAGQIMLERGHRLPVGSQSVIGQVTSTGQSTIALDTSTSTIHRRNELLPDTRAELALPLRSGGTVIGALDLQSVRPDAFSQADIELFQSIADQLTIAIENARLFEESRTRLEEIEILNRRLISDAWRSYGNARRRPLPSATAATASIVSASEEMSELQEQAMQTGEVAERIHGEIVTVAVPVSLRNEVLGAIEWDMPRDSYNENVRQLAQELAARLAITADNARLFEQSQRLAERERLVNEIASKLTQQTDVSVILQTAVREVGQALRVPQASIRLSVHDQTAPIADEVKD